MSEWLPTTDEDLPFPQVPERLYASMQEFGAGQAEIGGYPKEDDERRSWTVFVAEGPNGEYVAGHIDWNEQTIVTAWREKSTNESGPE